MTTVKIPYAKKHLELSIPADRLQGILQSKAESFTAEADEATLVKTALANPIGSPRLAELAKGKKHIVIITSDHTRPVPSRIISPLLVEEIRSTNPDGKITFLVATGFHRATTEAELNAKFGEAFRKTIDIVIHDSQDDSAMVKIGKLPSGGSTIVNKLAMEADLLVGEGFIEPHFFAGFSGGRKSVLPGIASQVTVLYNHCSQFIDSEKARTGNLAENPIHKDMLAAAEQAKLAFILNVVIDAEKKIIKAFAGHSVKAHEEGCQFVGELASVKACPADIVVTSNGGYPLDQNLYQSVKGMSAAEATVKPGGVIIICSACNDGHGGEAFYDWFAKAPGGASEVMEKIMQIPAEKTIADQWEAQILARIQLKAHVIVVTDLCDHQMFKDMQVAVTSTLEEAMAEAEKIVGAKASITVIPDGVSVIVRP
ncbi:MAG: nickel-dependent lactate racemase [Sporomusaceae bacterium]|nr:nickel-dependent lactate racemase [Sporomusaceae bacterium]